MKTKNYKIEKSFTVAEYECSVIGTRLGHRCGYVGLPKGHKYEDVDYDGIEVNVHGGLTYGAISDGSIGISEGRKVLGFDCAHYNDGKDYNLIKELNEEKTANYMINMDSMFPDDSIARDVKYVENELRELVKQLD